MADDEQLKLERNVQCTIGTDNFFGNAERENCHDFSNMDLDIEDRCANVGL